MVLGMSVVTLYLVLIIAMVRIIYLLLPVEKDPESDLLSEKPESTVSEELTAVISAAVLTHRK